MLRSFFAVLVVFALSLTACASSNNATPTDKIAGTYLVSATKTSGDCADITDSATWTFKADGAQYLGTMPTDATSTGGTFTEATGRATYGYTEPEPAGACMSTLHANFDLTFTNAGFTGTLTLADCNGPTKCTGVYALTGERR